jgi:branched-chain amino acid transport system permease protein
VLGAAVLVLLSELLRSTLAQAHVLIYGLLVIVVIVWMPDGFVGFITARLRRKAAQQ